MRIGYYILFPSLSDIYFSIAGQPKQDVRTKPDYNSQLFAKEIIHPRLLLNPNRINEIRSSIGTTHAFFWNRYLQDLPRMVSVSKRELPLEEGARYEGDLTIEIAFAWLITGREDLRDIEKWKANHY